MADKVKNLSDRTPRDASNMGSNSQVSLYVGIGIGVVVVALILYWVGAV